MNKSIKYFTEGLIAAFVLAPRAPVQAVEPIGIDHQVMVGNAAKHWESVGKKMSLETSKISNELNLKNPYLNSL